MKARRETRSGGRFCTKKPNRTLNYTRRRRNTKYERFIINIFKTRSRPSQLKIFQRT